ncbi:hypothetical protein PRIPAC_87452 [Pristionchus pacificus]|uniref:Uncharacterized protein n=1 Tax=Pristionchus pacificus TaxID=54126 RepID=A0A2A6CWG9_PRIPA|nr:hypothetical protein PRIPAC_87452 [Pristionchus pacificus]|eukprot:PDM82584.1 hypothetical protein PRIPAC_36977 [Pristionchus pacificus]
MFRRKVSLLDDTVVEGNEFQRLIVRDATVVWELEVVVTKLSNPVVPPTPRVAVAPPTPRVPLPLAHTITRIVIRLFHVFIPLLLFIAVDHPFVDKCFRALNDSHSSKCEPDVCRRGCTDESGRPKRHMDWFCPLNPSLEE